MNFPNLAETTVVFDLDDTLYREVDYVDSGVRYVCAQLKSLCGKDIYPKVHSAILEGAKDWIAVACEFAGLSIASKDSLLWMYRLHMPDIQLDPICEKVLRKIEKRASAVAILTDGRSVTQRKKLMALGLGDWPVFISEDYSSEKPRLERFLIIQDRYPAKRYVYVGDNVKKDFIGCNRLDWFSIGLWGDVQNIHSQNTDGLPVEALPREWISNWEQLLGLLS